MRAVRRVGAAVTAVVTAAMGLSACSSSPSGAPGLTATTVKVGALATESGPLSSGFGEIVDGVRAYFDMVNAEGGVDGRHLELADVADDDGSPTTDTQAARRLVESDHVFAIVGVGTPFFSAATYLAGTGTPTFGEVVSSEWAGHDNLFGTFGSTLDYSTNASAIAWFAHQEGATTAAVVAYGGVAQSEDACKADAAGMEHYGISVPVTDYAYQLGGNPDADVFRMAADHVQLLISCLEGPDSLKFDQVMKQYHLQDTATLWLDGYSRTVVAQNAAAMQRVFFLFQHVPFEVAPEYATKYPGMEQYVEEMQRYAPQWTYDETALQGWIEAAQFVAGLRAAGKHPTQQAVVAAINNETAFTAGGLMPPVDWRVAHTSAPPPWCSAFALAYNGSTVPALLRAGAQVFACFNAKSDEPVASPKGTPDATGSSGAASG